MKRTIDGVDCRIEPDAQGLGFWDIFIDHREGEEPMFGQSHGTKPGDVYLEWIVRGAVDKETAIQTARRCIEALRSGHILLQHDPEGIIRIMKNPVTGGDQ